MSYGQLKIVTTSRFIFVTTSRFKSSRRHVSILQQRHFGAWIPIHDSVSNISWNSNPIRQRSFFCGVSFQQFHAWRRDDFTTYDFSNLFFVNSWSENETFVISNHYYLFNTFQIWCWNQLLILFQYIYNNFRWNVTSWRKNAYI